MPRVSVIVPVRNEAAHVRRTLLGLVAQSYADFELLVIDGRSDDGTADVVRDLQATVPDLYLFDNPKRLASAARNVGVRHARGDFLVIVDGHCRVRDPHFLANLARSFDETGADTLGRPQPLRAENPTGFQRCVAAARTSWLGHNPGSAIYSNVAGFVAPDNVAVAYRRDVFDRVGLFDESFDACEDVEFNTRVRRAGLTCYFTPAIAVEYQPRASLWGLAYQLARYGRGRARLARKFPTTVTVPSLVPPLWLVWLAAGAVVSVFSPFVALVVGASLAAYLLLVFAESVRVWRAEPSVSLVRLPVVFVAIHLGFGWGYLRETAAGLSDWPAAIARWLVRRFAPAARPTA
jgi:succinoglycan biosynthesis protein ExoA